LVVHEVEHKSEEEAYVYSIVLGLGRRMQAPIRKTWMLVLRKTRSLITVLTNPLLRTVYIRGEMIAVDCVKKKSKHFINAMGFNLQWFSNVLEQRDVSKSFSRCLTIH
jgi:hypothetical protein